MSGFSTAQAIISAMITPALLIMGSGSLIATALTRMARVVDRVRKLAETPGSALSTSALLVYQHRAVLAGRAIRLLVFAIVCFVLVGFAIAFDHWSGDRLTWLPVAMTAAGMVLIVAGCTAILAESRLASIQIRTELGVLLTSIEN